MDTWYKITLPFGESTPNGKGQRLIDSFGARLIASGGIPRDAALFSRRSDDFDEMSYYFSPAAFQIAKLLVESSGAIPCPAPSAEGLIMCAGDDRAREMLWPPKGQSN